ncbi:hypothetical protein IGI04_016211 [Brassica rapa subsp. trilocularis]|uniref:Uncharacterized protein n=1 Tax=Brassica rapa subsp. trilocularis TaxID=1813537 RepID=A0ABQ7MSB6_BRACM|nr:hypothetical protein IGI04_016211 [Brassica rapa subsp. trilocularis]
MGAVRVYTVCDESRSKKECKPMDAEDCEEFTDVFWLKFHLQRGSWMNLFSWGIAFRSHNAPEFESLRRWSTNSIEETLPLLEFHLTRSILGSSSMNQTVKTVREKLDKIQESGNQKRIIQPISQNLQIEPDSKKTRVDNNRRRI